VVCSTLSALLFSGVSWFSLEPLNSLSFGSMLVIFLIGIGEIVFSRSVSFELIILRSLDLLGDGLMRVEDYFLIGGSFLG
jgi:hypothetical protein